MKYATPNCVYTKSRRTACTVHLMKTTEASQRGRRKAIYGKILHRYWCKIPNKKCRYRQTDWLWAHEMSSTDFVVESRHDDAEVLLVTVYNEYKLLENTWMKKKHWESNFSFTQECKLHQEDVVLSKYFKIMQLHLRRCKMHKRALSVLKNSTNLSMDDALPNIHRILYEDSCLLPLSSQITKRNEDWKTQITQWHRVT